MCSVLDVFIPALACQQNIACNEYQQWGFCRTLGGTITLPEKSIFSSNTLTWNEESQTLTKLHLVLTWKIQCSDNVKDRSLDGFFLLEWPKNNIRNAWGILIGGISCCRSLHGLALAGHLLLHPAHTADGPDVLHAWDAALPAVKGQEAWGRGGVAVLAGTRRPHRMGVRPYWRWMRWTGESTEGDASGSDMHLIQSWIVPLFTCRDPASTY